MFTRAPDSLGSVPDQPSWTDQQLTLFVNLTSPEHLDLIIGAPTQDQVTEAAAVAEKIVDRELPRWCRDIPTPRPHQRWTQIWEAALRTRTLLRRREELLAHLEPQAPTLSAGGFHPWAREGARSTWSVGSYDRAVEDAPARVNAETRIKVDRRDLGETKLFQLVFSTEAPKPGVPRLRLIADDGSDTYKSVHCGATALAEGLFALLPNPAAHEVRTHEGQEQVARKHLAAVSTMARTVDQAQVV